MKCLQLDFPKVSNPEDAAFAFIDKNNSTEFLTLTYVYTHEQSGGRQKSTHGRTRGKAALFFFSCLNEYLFIKNKKINFKNPNKKQKQNKIKTAITTTTPQY